MKKWIGIGTVWLFMTLFACTGLEAASVKWYDDYSKAEQVAAQESKPMVLLFTGSDWCGWCVRLKEDILDTPQFAQAVGNDFIFVYVDFPAQTTLPDEIAAQNRDLRTKFNVQAFPTIVVLNAKGDKLGQASFNGSESPQEFANKLKSIAGDANGLQNAVSNLDTLELSDGELKELYLKAKALERPDFAARLLERGVRQSDGTYFLAEKYRALVADGKGLSEEGREVRSELLARDRHNTDGYVRMVAVLDFQQRAEDRTLAVERVIEPLERYLERFGSSDPSGRWRIQMTLAQFLASRGERERSEQYARQSLEGAPEALSDEIVAFIDSVQG